MKAVSGRVVVLVIVGITVGLMLTTGSRVWAMKALSSSDMDGFTAQSGLSIFFQNLDASLLRINSIELDLSPGDTGDWTFRIVDDNKTTSLFVSNTHDTDNYAFSFCGSGTNEAEPIAVDYLGFDIDVARGRCAGDTAVNANIVTLSMVGYGSTAFYNVWELAQFVSPGGTPYDVFGLTLGEIFWAEKYMDPDKSRFMHLMLSPLAHYAASAFVDSNQGAWQNAYTGVGDIRSNVGIGGELGLKPGGGKFGFSGFDQEATANSVMLAGKIIDKGPNGTFPNWKTHNATYYYQDSLSKWNILGEAVIGVHHHHDYTRTGYVWGYDDGTNTGTFTNNTAVQNLIGEISDTRPMRIDVATDTSTGYTYLVSYLCGHYSRTVYYPDSTVSTMGDSPYNSGAPTERNAAGDLGFWRDYIIGDLRIGRLQEKTNDMNGDGTVDSVTHSGSWVVNDISLPYNKMVIPGDRSLTYETSAGSEGFIIPNRDYGSNGVNNVSTRMAIAEPVSTSRTMQVATPFDGTGSDPLANSGVDLSRPASWWN